MATPVYVLCDNNCKYEGMTKEQILTAIMQAVESGTVGDCNTGFITTVKTINGRGLRFFVGTQAEYDSLSKTQKDGVFALITNDTTKDGLLEAIRDLQEEQSNINNTFTAITAGAFAVPEASHAVNADYAERAGKLASYELTRDNTNGGFYVTETGVYLIIAVSGDVNDPTGEQFTNYRSGIVVIPKLYRAAGGIGEDGSYDTYDMDLFNADKFRLKLVREGFVEYKAYRLMSL